MDEEAMERFDALPESDLKEDILQHIQKKQDGYYFMNRPDGSCMMLDPDGFVPYTEKQQGGDFVLPAGSFQDWQAECSRTTGCRWRHPAL